MMFAGLSSNKPPKGGKVTTVQRTDELMRVASIIRRVWEDDNAKAFARSLSVALLKPGRSGELRPIQAMLLYEFARMAGGIGSIRTGGGKTLIALLAPFFLKLHRPLLLLPAKLIEKTRREQRILSLSWPIPTNIQIMSYELLGREQSVEKLFLYRPDGIIADEVHKLKNPDAAVTKRVRRYVERHPEVAFLGLTGTLTKGSLKDYAHLLQWALPRPDCCPVPMRKNEIEEWAAALDFDDNPANPGALLSYLCNADDAKGDDGEKLSPTATARRGFRRRLAESPGVIMTSETFTGASLTVQSVTAPLPKVDPVFYQLRNDWELPGDIVLSEPHEVKRAARQLGLGFYYRWDPDAPKPWKVARKAWSKACRHILETNQRDLDSAKAVALHIDRFPNHYPEAVPLLAAWRAIAPTFEPNTVPVWLDDGALQRCADWAKGGGILWTEHVAFGNRLSELTGIPYYGAKGLCGKKYIEDHPADQPLIASAHAANEGMNLQKWSRNLLIGMTQNALHTEQLISRTHRDGQTADEVIVDVLMMCAEHVNDFHKVIENAQYTEAITGQAQRILYADSIVDEMPLTGEWRWFVRGE